jgi:hypothetical protein
LAICPPAPKIVCIFTPRDECCVNMKKTQH